jgi:hypothetical protein
VPNGDVAFLDALRIIRRNIQQKINFATELPARFSGERHEIRPASEPGFYTANDVGTASACRERHKYVVFGNEGLNLSGKDVFKSVVVARCRQYRRICGERQSRQARPFGSQAHHQFSGETQRIPGAASIPEKYSFATAAQGGRGFFRELRDSAYQFTGKLCLTRALSSSWWRISSAGEVMAS